MIERIICGDNLEILKTFEDEFVDLIYIDPPFFTNKNYEVIWGDGAEIRQFGDRWITENKNGSGRARKDINVYLEWMEPRIKELYRVLKKTGSFYLHCDWHADAYLRILCDKIFNYKTTIIWLKASGGKHSTIGYDSVYDSIHFYTKSNKFIFNIQFLPYTKNQIRNFKYIDEKGIYKKRSLKAGGTQVSKNRRIFTYKGCTGMWVNSEETLEKLDKNGDLIIENNCLYRKQRPKEGIKLTNLWTDISMSSSNERIGYPTQKPEALLERIIRASSNEGDVVLDAFCGCGTTLAVAKKLKRQWIGIDVSPTACRLVAGRLKMRFDVIEGLPITPEEITQLDGYEFQNFIIREFGGFSGNRGADGGIDGKLGECPIQVKKFKAGRVHLDAFCGALLREGQKEGIFIATEFSSDFKSEVARLKRENDITIHYFDVNDIVEKKHHSIINKFSKGFDKYKK